MYRSSRTKLQHQKEKWLPQPLSLISGSRSTMCLEFRSVGISDCELWHRLCQQRGFSSSVLLTKSRLRKRSCRYPEVTMRRLRAVDHQGDVLWVGQQQEVVSAPPHATKAVVAEHVEDVVLHFVSRFLQQQQHTGLNKSTRNFLKILMLLLPFITHSLLLVYQYYPDYDTPGRP